MISQLVVVVVVVVAVVKKDICIVDNNNLSILCRSLEKARYDIGKAAHILQQCHIL